MSGSIYETLQGLNAPEADRDIAAYEAALKLGDSALAELIKKDAASTARALRLGLLSRPTGIPYPEIPLVSDTERSGGPH